MSLIVSSLNLAAQVSFVVVLVKGISYVSKTDLKRHGRWMVIFTGFLLVSSGIFMLPRLLALVQAGDYSLWVVGHGVLGIFTLIGASYVSIDWARMHFGEDEHEGSRRMWGTTLFWISAFLSGIWVYLLLYNYI